VRQKPGRRIQMRGKREAGEERLTSHAKYMMIIEAVWSKQARKELLIFRSEAWFISQCYLQIGDRGGTKRKKVMIT